MCSKLKPTQSPLNTSVDSLRELIQFSANSLLRKMLRQVPRVSPRVRGSHPECLQTFREVGVRDLVNTQQHHPLCFSRMLRRKSRTTANPCARVNSSPHSRASAAKTASHSGGGFSSL